MEFISNVYVRINKYDAMRKRVKPRRRKLPFSFWKMADAPPEKMLFELVNGES